MVLLIPLAIILISLFTIFPAFHIGLYGDDWLAIFRYIVHVSPPSKEGWNLFTYYLTPYGSQDIIMGLLYKSFGTNAFYYEITSYIFRMIAAFSLFPLVFYLTKNKLATFFAILFFSVTTIGFDSTGWLLTMPTYLTIAFFNIFVYFYLLFHENKKVKFLILSGLFFYLGYITASARMIGAPLFVLTLELFWFIKNPSRKSMKNSLIRIFTIFAILIFISVSGHSLGNSNDWFSRLNSGLADMQKSFSTGHTEFIFYPVVTIGGMFIPNFKLPNIQIATKLDMASVLFTFLLIFLFILFFIKTNVAKIRIVDIYKVITGAAIWIIAVFVIRKFNFETFSSSNLILSSIIGGLSIILWVFLAIKYSNQKKILNSLFISISWTILAFFLPWVWSPNSYIDTTHRYLTASAVGISIFFATLISLGKKNNNQIYLFILFSVFLLINIVSTRTYIDKLLNSHSQRIVDNIWSSLSNIPKLGKEPLVFYFERDETNGSILGDSVMFGFPFHTAVLYNLKETDKIPVPLDSWKDVVSASKDGKSLKPYGYPIKPIPIENIYGFRLLGQDNLVNITETIHQKLSEENR